MILKRKSLQIFAVVIAAVMIAAVWVSGPLFDSETAYAAAPSGNFNPKTAVLEQGEYDADMYYVFYNGNFYTKMTDPGNKATGDEGKFETASVLVAKDQKIEYLDVTSAGALAAWITAEEAAENVKIGSAEREGADAIWIDLKGETVIPGLHDSHIHYTYGGATRYAPDIFWKSLAEIRIIVRNEVAKTEPGKMISASGWNQTLDTWNGGNTDFPTKEDLDDVAPANPVVLNRTDGHANWANSLAIRMSPYGGGALVGGEVVPGPENPADWPINKPSDPLYTPPVGGEIIRDANGMATGVFVDATMSVVTRYSSNIPSATDTSNVEANALSANDYLLSYGITSFTEAGANKSAILLYKDLYADGKMKTRGSILVINTATDSEGNYVDSKTDDDFRTSPGTIEFAATDYRLKVKGTKTSLDGALGSRGAELLEPYSDAGTAEVPAGHKGAGLRYTDTQVYDILKRNLEAGWTPGFHAIGDATNNQVIDAMDDYLTTDKGLTKGSDGLFDQTSVAALGLRPRIEHYQITTKGAIERTASMNITPSMQFVHATSDMSMAGARVGNARLQYSYAWRKIIDEGMVIANGTDWMVDLLNPYHGLSAGVTRMDRDGKAPKSPLGVGVPWNPITTKISKASDERVTRAEALHYYSWGGAYGDSEETSKGSLEVGKLADFVVLDRDYFDPAETKDSDIKDINALMTVVGGEICYTMESPSIITDEVGDSRVGMPYAFTVTGNTDHSPTYHWSITDRDPELKWLQLDYHSGALSGTPKKAGTYEFDVTASNYLGSETTTLSMTVNPKDTPAPPEPPTPEPISIEPLSLTIANQTWTGGQVKPAVQVTLAGKTLVLDTDYAIAYGTNKNIGKGSLTITGMNEYTGTKAFTFKILPKKTSVSKVTVGKKKATVSWKKVSSAQKITKYQVQYRIKGAAKWKTKTVAASKSSLSIKSLKKGKQYQFRVRAYKTVSGVKYYAAWSSAKTSKKVK